MRVLVACECTGAVRDAFLTAGVDAWSCDLKPTETPGPHIQGDALKVLRWGWDLMVCHPECRYLSSSGLHWNTRPGGEGRALKTEAAVAFALALWRAPIPFIALENPVGRLGTAIGPASQSIQPYEFGEDASKRTCLWLKGLPRLAVDPARRLAGRTVTDPRSGKSVERWSNQTDSGQNRLGPSETRSADRAATYPAIAAAMARQWTAAVSSQLALAA
ncbi:hypothetical protein [Sphingomonas sp.]|uniref:hypothetical protein n=1 Tax=Sphingomonas sp. TaxID=28214 RepID=UPI003B000A5B